MKNSDFIQMSQCAMYSIKFPHDEFVKTVESIELYERGDGFSVEVVTNPLTNQKVQHLEKGYFFTMRVSYKKLSKEMILAKVFELKATGKGKPWQFFTEKELVKVAEKQLYASVPASSEIMNVFYSHEKELMIVNKRSKHCRTALSLLIETFGLAGFRSVVVSDEKLGLNTRLQKYLDDYTPMFKHLRFENEATLYKRVGDDEAHLLCRHLDNKEKREKAREAMADDYRVQSVAMRYDDGHFKASFKLSSGLKIRSMKFAEYSDVARQLNNPKTAAKDVVMAEYLAQQFEMLLKTAESTVLEFVDGTKLEGFV